MTSDGGLSDRDLLLGTGNAWTQGLGLLLVVIGLGTCCLWYALHGGRTPLTLVGRLLTVWRRGRNYRRRQRAARHRRSTFTHHTFRSPVR